MKSKTALTFQAQNAKEKENTFKKLACEIKKHVVIIHDSVKIKRQMFMHVVDIHQCNINDVRMSVTRSNSLCNYRTYNIINSPVCNHLCL